MLSPLSTTWKVAAAHYFTGSHYWKPINYSNWKPLNYPVNLETCKVHNLFQPFRFSNYHLFVISSTNNWKNCQFHLSVERSFSHLHSMCKDGMLKDGDNTESACNLTCPTEYPSYKCVRPCIIATVFPLRVPNTNCPVCPWTVIPVNNSCISLKCA